MTEVLFVRGPYVSAAHAKQVEQFSFQVFFLFISIKVFGFTNTAKIVSPDKASVLFFLFFLMNYLKLTLQVSPE